MTPPHHRATDRDDAGIQIMDASRIDSCDIFCTVIDNYGDIGVSWRLARQLANEYAIAVRLWVDDLAALQRIWPVTTTDSRQYIDGVEVHWWQKLFADVEAAALVIEAFACTLPDNYIQAMARRAQPSLWINLEYLSAEAWVADCHALPSPYVLPLSAADNGSSSTLNKYFFFPGFSERTGGLLRERDLLSRRQTFQADPHRRAEFLARFGVADMTAFTLSLFAYENAALPVLLAECAKSAQPILCLVPEGRSLPALANFFNKSALTVGATYRHGALTVVVLPFLTQDDYDRLLWSCDLNLVRGEDSFVRGQWAARPLFWHIYPQPEDAHWPKLTAFLELYCAQLAAPAAAALRDAWSAWNGVGDMGVAWRALAPHLAALAAHARSWSEQLAGRGNLSAALVQFCANHV
jgi:uncharacterized repeat protein (TIGR03837 family)